MKVKTQQVLIMLKPDTLLRGMVGTIFDELEKIGLKLVACKMENLSDEKLIKHYRQDDKEYVKSLGSKTLKNLEILNIEHDLGTDEYSVGIDVHRKLVEYMKSAPVILTVWEGFNAIEVARKLRGTTVPLNADSGTILSRFSHDSSVSSTMKSRAIMNLLHVSGNEKEAQEEIALWFGEDFKPLEYSRVDEYFF